MVELYHISGNGSILMYNLTMDLMITAISLILLLFSVIIHEIMHGVAALWFGDTTAEREGRLTLNPLAHIDPIGTILLPLVGFLTGGVIFGWAKPVPVNPLYFSNIRLGELVVSLAGVVSNLFIAVVAAVLIHTTGDMWFPWWSTILSFLLHINLVLAVFNMIPIPPLDGSKVLMVFLPPHLAREYARIEQYGFIILLLTLPFLGSILRIGVNFLHMLLGV